ncbi:MAG: hypothetical protein II072_08260, partial [Clostridia bacterium]|nr:hypothetical protein [Clostridia bacterium]
VPFTFWENILFFLAMIVSAAIVFFSAKRLSDQISIRTDTGDAFRRFTLCMLGAAAVMFLPVYYLRYSFGDGAAVLRPALLSVHNAMRLFILDGEFDFVVKSIAGMNGVLHVFFSLYAALMYVICPAIFTFAVIVSVFRFAFAKLRFRNHDDSPLFVFSCLNEESAAMAKSILGRKNKGEAPDRDMIVFCGVPKDDEKRKELTNLVPYTKGEDAYVLFLNEEADQLDVSQFKQDITFFLMDTDEAKNVQDASKLSEKLNIAAAKKAKAEAGNTEDRHNVRVLVYSSSPASAPLIDAISRNRAIPVELMAKLTATVSDMLKRGSGAEAVRAGILKVVGDDFMPAETLRALNGTICEVLQQKADFETGTARILDAATRNLVVPSGTVKCLNDAIDKISDEDVKIAYPLKMLDTIRSTISDKGLHLSAPFSIMRIDKETQLAAGVVREILSEQHSRHPKNDEEALTVTMIGLGGIGKEILENLLWMGQRYGRELIVNVFDATGPKLGRYPDSAHNPLYDRLASEWPELIETNREWQNGETAHPDTEADYDVRFFFGTDCFSNRFRKLFEAGSEVRERLLKSDAVICSLGDDDKSLKAAIMMRQLFVGKAVENHREADPELYSKPGIYAVIYDDMRANRVNGQVELTNYKNQPYNIKAVGSMQSQFSYDGITDLEKNEKEAVVHHISWIFVRSEGQNASSWSDNKANNKNPENTAQLRDELNNYIHYEYYRNSSLTKAVHKYMLNEQGAYPNKAAGHSHDPNVYSTDCDLCRSRITEHMRWNAYMRVIGYRRFCYEKNGKLIDTRSDMARIHKDLKPWNKLDPKDQVKD